MDTLRLYELRWVSVSHGIYTVIQDSIFHIHCKMGNPVLSLLT